MALQEITHSTTAAVRHLYAAASALHGGTYEAQLTEAAAQVAGAFSAHGGQIVHQAVFLRDPAQAEPVSRLLHKLHGAGRVPATSYIHQAPCDGRSLVALEATGVAGAATVEYRSPQVTAVRHDGITWVQTALPPAPAAGAYGRTLQALEQTRLLLESAGARLDQVVRTWFYVGGIVADEAGSSPAVQRYKEFNRARAEYFQDIRFLAERVPPSARQPVYPASTGIGMAGGDVSLSALALVTRRSDVLAVPLENPRQVAAFHYGPHYSPQSPKFSRAMAVVQGDRAITYVSGTASITASETRHPGNVSRQTEETLANITALIGEENFAGHGLPGLGSGLSGLGLVRAYVKHPADYPAVRAVCEKRLGGIPIVYSTGDVCRGDLLVELEGIAHSARPVSAAPGAAQAPGRNHEAAL